MQKHARLTGLILLIVSSIFLTTALAQSTGVTATVINQVNLRANTFVESDKVGELAPGVTYPVIGRNEFYPWLLIGDPDTGDAIGWAFNELLTVNGSVNNLPFTDIIVDPSSVPSPVAQPTTNSDTAPETGQAQSGQTAGGPIVTVNAPTNTGDVLATASAEPATNQPTATPVFTVAGTTLGEINVRYGPNTTFPRVGVAAANERFQITAYHTQVPWVQVRFEQSPNERAWIQMDLLTIEGNIYSLPSVSDATLNLPPLEPTPSVLSSSSFFSDSPSNISPEFAALGDRIWSLMLDNRFDLATSRFGSMFLLDLQTGEAITFGNEIAYSGTSLNKVAILMRLYASLSTPPDARLATDIANTMICSENVATNRLLNAIGNGDEFAGAAQVTELLSTMGLTDSFITYPYLTDPENPPVPSQPISIPETSVDQTKADPDLSNQTTVEDMGWLLASLYQCAYEDSGPLVEEFDGLFEGRECRQMIHVMANNTVDALLKAGVPEDVRVAHKHGWISTTHSNGGIFFTPGGNYVMVMFMYQPDWLNFQESLPVIAEASRIVYNYYNPDAPLGAVREGFIPEANTCNFNNSPLTIDIRQPVWDD